MRSHVLSEMFDASLERTIPFVKPFFEVFPESVAVGIGSSPIHRGLMGCRSRFPDFVAKAIHFCALIYVTRRAPS